MSDPTAGETQVETMLRIQREYEAAEAADFAAHPEDRPTAGDHVCDSGYFDRTLCAEPCGAMHSYCDNCGRRDDPCAHETDTDDVAQPGPGPFTDEDGNAYPPNLTVVTPADPDAGDMESLARLLNHPPRAGDHNLARAVLASDWLASREAAAATRARAEAWDEAIEAVAWCLDNGEPSAAAALAYVHQNNRYRLAPDAASEDTP